MIYLVGLEQSTVYATTTVGYKYETPLDPRVVQETEERIITEKGFVLVPNEVYLYACNERIGCKKIYVLKYKLNLL
jgi:hypothetical protein